MQRVAPCAEQEKGALQMASVVQQQRQMAIRGIGEEFFRRCLSTRQAMSASLRSTTARRLTGAYACVSPATPLKETRSVASAVHALRPAPAARHPAHMAESAALNSL